METNNPPGSASFVGTLGIGNGGTNSNAVLSNNRIMKSSAGAIIEAAAITANRALISDANGIPVFSVVTNTELAFVNGVTSAIQTQFAGKAAIGANGDITSLTTAAGVPVHGTNTNDNAAAGYIGEYLSASTSTFTNLPGTTDVYGDMGSISLTAGDWDVSLIAMFRINTASVTYFDAGIGTASGSSSTGLVTADTALESVSIPTSGLQSTLSLPAVRKSLAGTTTIYAKIRAGFTGGPPQYAYRLSARRVR